MSGKKLIIIALIYFFIFIIVQIAIQETAPDQHKEFILALMKWPTIERQKSPSVNVHQVRGRRHNGHKHFIPIYVDWQKRPLKSNKQIVANRRQRISPLCYLSLSVMPNYNCLHLRSFHRVKKLKKMRGFIGQL